jgi:hypothetical protein
VEDQRQVLTGAVWSPEKRWVMRCTSLVSVAADFCGRRVRLKRVEGNRGCTRRAVHDDNDIDVDVDEAEVEDEDGGGVGASSGNVEEGAVDGEDGDEDEDGFSSSPCRRGR